MLKNLLQKTFLNCLKLQLMSRIYSPLYNFFNILHKKIISKKKYYSFGGIDIIVDYIFKDKKNGRYIDVGCQHPILNNNTYLLHKRGWRGINIDLDKENIKLFNYARNDDFNLKAAISSNEGESDLFFYHNKSPINTLNKKVSQHRNAKVKEIKRIKTTTLNSAIEKSFFKNDKFDFLSIDVEGLELEVLKGFDLKKYSPAVIVIEYLDLSTKMLEIKNLNIDNVLNSELYRFMINNNYSFVNWLHADLVFVNNTFKDKI